MNSSFDLFGNPPNMGLTPNSDSSDFEEEEDLEESEEISVEPAPIVYGTDWTTETIVSQINKGNILLNPEFQRRDAWDNKRKSAFIESIILGLPIPQIVLAELKDKKGKYIVLDGKQRLLSIRQFVSEAGDNTYNHLVMSGLTMLKTLNGASYQGLKDALQTDILSAFENQSIRTVIVKNWNEESLLYSIFLRLNTGSVKLSPQELRQALHPGPFVTYAELISRNCPVMRKYFKMVKPDFRMRDTELLVRWFAMSIYISRYSGNLKQFLDDACKDLNNQWAGMQSIVEKSYASLLESDKEVHRIFGTNSYKKFTGNGYEGAKNRAVFEIMNWAFSTEAIRNSAVGHEKEIVDLFENLCRHNSEFLGTIEKTTKSIGATKLRFGIWGKELSRILDTPLAIPVIG